MWKSIFNEPLGRYETYYIAEAYKARIRGWVSRTTRISRNGNANARNPKTLSLSGTGRISSKTGKAGRGSLPDPLGTMHGHGGNQMVLEMDTNPSINGTEYSFFEYDFARPSWDDEAQSMTGKPLKMHLEHGFDMEKCRRASWVDEHLRATPSVVKWTKDYFIDRYKSLPEMPYHVNVSILKNGWNIPRRVNLCTCLRLPSVPESACVPR